MMHLDLHLTDSTQLRAHSRVDQAGRPFAEITWDFHGPLPESPGNGVLWGTTAAMRRLAELILQAARLAEEEAAWQTHTARVAAARQGRVA
jgi:DNA-binding GntR family transcriptional regulator